MRAIAPKGYWLWALISILVPVFFFSNATAIRLLITSCSCLHTWSTSLRTGWAAISERETKKLCQVSALAPLSVLGANNGRIYIMQTQRNNKICHLNRSNHRMLTSCSLQREGWLTVAQPNVVLYYWWVLSVSLILVCIHSTGWLWVRPHVWVRSHWLSISYVIHVTVRHSVSGWHSEVNEWPEMKLTVSEWLRNCLTQLLTLVNLKLNSNYSHSSLQSSS